MGNVHLISKDAPLTSRSHSHHTLQIRGRQRNPESQKAQLTSYINSTPLSQKVASASGQLAREHTYLT